MDSYNGLLEVASQEHVCFAFKTLIAQLTGGEGALALKA